MTHRARRWGTFWGILILAFFDVILWAVFARAG